MRGRPSDSRISKNVRRPSSKKSQFNLPTDLLIEIFKRLSLKSLIRLTCVCKFCYSLLASPTFISAHVSHNFTKTNDEKSPISLLFKDRINLHDVDCRLKFFIINSKDMSIRREIECSVTKKYFVVSSRDGLLCLFAFYSQNPNKEPLILWNPSIQRIKVVPVPDQGSVDLTPWGFPKFIFGFGLDLISNEFKLVRVAYFNGDGFTCFRADVYGLDVGIWRVLDLTSVPQNFATIRWRGVYLYGVIHWACNVNASFDGNSVLKSILTFELGSEKFGEINLPMELSKATNNQSVRVVTVPKSSKEVLGVMQRFDKVLRLWVMETYGKNESWVMLYSLVINMVGHDMNVVVPTEEDVIVQEPSNAWVSCNVKSGRANMLRTTWDKLDYVDTYAESLILLGQGSRVSPVREEDQFPVKPRKGRRSRVS